VCEFAQFILLGSRHTKAFLKDFKKLCDAMPVDLDEMIKKKMISLLAKMQACVLPSYVSSRAGSQRTDRITSGLG
jgi:hypothetical protein